MIVSNARDLGLLIRHRRDELGLTQAEVASRSGVSRQWLIQVEQGKGTAEFDRVIRLGDDYAGRIEQDGGGLRLIYDEEWPAHDRQWCRYR